MGYVARVIGCISILHLKNLVFVISMVKQQGRTIVAPAHHGLRREGDSLYNRTPIEEFVYVISMVK